MNRRNFIQTTGFSIAAVLLSDSIFGRSNPSNELLVKFPDEVTAVVNNLVVKLSGKDGKWTYHYVVVNLIKTVSSIFIELQVPKVRLNAVTLLWKVLGKGVSRILNDHWERTYGDISWHQPIDSEILPWYVIEYNGKSTSGFGVKTGCNTFCSWKIGSDNLSLNLDTLSGGSGVELGDRKLKAAEIVTTKSQSGETPFETSRRVMKIMCAKARMPKQPVYGINDWYFSYGNNSEKLILKHTEMMAPMAEDLNNRPFSVIDAGWFTKPSGSADDCVGLTNKIPWAKNKQWTGLLAKSGTPMFISAQPDATGDDQKATIKECFKLVSQNLPVAEPLDWMENHIPERWKLNGKIETFNWE